jgi:translation initiation factor 4B
VEFTTLDGLKNALAMSMSQLAGRSIRVSVADAREYCIIFAECSAYLSTTAKEREGRGFGDRGGMGGSGFDEDRQWRREGPLPTHDDRRGGGGFDRREGGSGGGGFGRSSTSRFEDGDGAERGGFGSKFQPSGGREPLPPSVAEETNDWRSNMRAPPPPPAPERGSRFGSGFAGERFGASGGPGGPGGDNVRRRGSGINTPTGAESRSPKLGPADLEEKWTMGSRLKPTVQPSPERASAEGPFSRKFANGRVMEGKAGEGEGTGAGEDPSDWRSVPRKTLPGPAPATGSGRGTMERTPSKYCLMLRTGYKVNALLTTSLT